MKKNKIILWIQIIIWMIIIFCFSSQNADESTKTSGLFTKILEYLINMFFSSGSEEFKAALLDNCHFIVRKTAHFTEYAVLGILLYIAFTDFEKLSPKLKTVFPAAICLLYAASDEFHQYFVPGRSCQFRDVMIDFAGSVTGILLLIFIRSRIKKLHDNHSRQ